MVREWPVYVFDALPMAVVLVICWLWYVGDVINTYGSSVKHGHVELGAR